MTTRACPITLGFHRMGHKRRLPQQKITIYRCSVPISRSMHTAEKRLEPAPSRLHLGGKTTKTGSSAMNAEPARMVFHADHCGSLLRPPELREARRRHA